MLDAGSWQRKVSDTFRHEVFSGQQCGARRTYEKEEGLMLNICYSLIPKLLPNDILGNSLGGAKCELHYKALPHSGMDAPTGSSLILPASLTLYRGC